LAKVRKEEAFNWLKKRSHFNQMRTTALENKREETIPMGRLGETAEAGHFTVALLDGRNMYMTGNFFPVAGGFNNEGMKPF
jgi:NAD(P)-dependent dehydrogenase (short-subunit alcohol dehydrogenase family)